MSETVPPGDVPGTTTPWRQVHQVGAAAGASAGAGEGGTAGAVAGAAAGAEAARPFADAADEARRQAQDAAVDAGASKGNAERAAEDARTEADRASGKAADAEAKALLADEAANRAGLAAIQATTASPIYPDVATGLAATAEGDTFNVQGEGATYATTYRKVDGAAVYVSELPSKEAVDAIPARIASIPGVPVAIIGADGSVPFAIYGDGSRVEFGGFTFERASNGDLLIGGGDLPGVMRISGGGKVSAPTFGVGDSALTSSDLGSWLHAHLDQQNAAVFAYREGEFVAPGIQSRINPDGSWALHGPNGPVVTMTPDGGVDIPAGPASYGSVAGVPILLLDSQGNGIALDETFTPIGSSTGGGNDDTGDYSTAQLKSLAQEARDYSSAIRRRRPANLRSLLLAEIMLHNIAGQSLSSGWEGWPSLSREQFYDLVMMGRSVQPQGQSSAFWLPMGDDPALQPMVSTVRGVTAQLLTPAQQAALSPGAVNCGETPLEGSNNHLRRAYLLRYGHGLAGDPDHLWVAAADGVGARSIAQLSPGADPDLFQRYRDTVTLAQAQAVALGKTFAVGDQIIIQGEEDYSLGTTYEAYRDGLKAYIQARRDYAASIDGQVGIVPVFIVQTGGRFVSDAQQLAIGRAQIAVAREMDGVFIVSSTSPYPDKNGHLSSNGYRWMGNQIGKVRARVHLDREGWMGTHVKRWEYRGRTLIGLFHAPVPPLQFARPYTIWAVSNAYTSPSRGIYATDEQGEMTIDQVEIVEDVLVSARMSREPVGTLTVWLGKATPFVGATCIADSDTTPLHDVYEYTAGSGQYPQEDIPELVGLSYDACNFCLADVQIATAAS